MKISIIVAVFNGAKTLQRCLDSVEMQTSRNFELIIMDGGSTDDTISVIGENSDLISYWESKEDRGIAHAWNKALEHVKGDWILFLGADDCLADEHVLSDMVDVLSEDKGNDLVYGKMIFEGGDLDGLCLGADFSLEKIKRRMIIPHTAAFHRRTFFDEVGRYDENYKLGLDYEILLRKKNLSAHFIDRLVTVMGGEGVSSLLIKRSLLECRSAQLKNKADNRIKIELVNAFYLLRHYFNQLINKKGS